MALAVCVWDALRRHLSTGGERSWVLPRGTWVGPGALTSLWTGLSDGDDAPCDDFSGEKARVGELRVVEGSLASRTVPSLPFPCVFPLDAPVSLERVAQEDFIKGKQQWENGRENGGAIDVLALAVVLEHNR